MNFVLVTDGTWGDTLPFIFIAKELQQKGFRVTVCTNTYYKEYIESSGLSFVETTNLEERNTFLQNPDLWHPKKGMKVIGEYAGIMFEKTYPKLQETVNSETVIISHSFSYAAKTIAEKNNLKYVSLLISPIQLRTAYRFPVFFGGKDVNHLPVWFKKFLYPLVDRFVIDPCFNHIIQTRRKEVGLQPIKGFVHWATDNYPSIGLWPSWYVPMMPDQQLGFCAGFPKHVEMESNDHSDLIEWMAQGSSVILVTMGSGYLFSQNLFMTISNISKLHNQRFIFISRDIKEQSSEYIRVLSQVQFSNILPHCSAIIHHGGAGTLAQSMVHGIPQLILPMSHDQPDNAAFIDDQSFGKVLWNSNPTTEELYSYIQTIIISDKIREACLKARDRIEQEEDGIKKAVEHILEL